jgi:hypothetical protein
VNNSSPVEFPTATRTSLPPILATPDSTITPNESTTPGSQLVVLSTESMLPSMGSDAQATDQANGPLEAFTNDNVVNVKNPAILDAGDILLTLGKGILLVSLVFGLFGLIFTFRRK